MPVKTFQPNEFRDEVKQALKDGATPQEILARFPVSKTSVYRWVKDIKDEQAGIVPASKKSTAAGVNIPGVSKEAFTPLGVGTLPPPGAPPGEYLTVGTTRMPLLDFGYSTTRNLFVVADTFEIARKEYKFPPTMKLGDFLAELCQAFRLMRGWDVIGAGVYPVKIEQEKREGKDK